MIQMDCPECGESLELDAGFAGGVARCKYCAAMFTVPKDAKQQPARVLQHDDEADTGVVAPKRQKNMKVRVVTAAILVAVLLGIVGAFVASVVFVATAPTASEQQAAVVSEMNEAIRAEPYATPGLNALGIPLRDRAVVIVDADYRGADWLEAVNAALLHGLTRPSNDAVINLIYTAEPLPMMLASAMINTDELAPSLISALMDEVTADGTPALDEAVRLSLQFEPRQLVIVIGRELSNDEMSLLEAALAEAKRKIEVTVVMIDKDDSALDKLATSSGGLYVPISQRIIGEWEPPQ